MCVCVRVCVCVHAYALVCVCVTLVSAIGTKLILLAASACVAQIIMKSKRLNALFPENACAGRL